MDASAIERVGRHVAIKSTICQYILKIGKSHGIRADSRIMETARSWKNAISIETREEGNQVKKFAV